MSYSLVKKNYTTQNSDWKKRRLMFGWQLEMDITEGRLENGIKDHSHP